MWSDVNSAIGDVTTRSSSIGLNKVSTKSNEVNVADRRVDVTASGGRAGCDARESLVHILQQCHSTHHQRIERHNGIVRYLTSRLKEKGWRVLQEPHYRPSQDTKIAGLVIHRDQQSVVLDVQVVGTQVALSDAYELKRNKYLFSERTQQINSDSSPVVAAVTMSYRGTGAREPANILTDVGLGRNDFKLMSIRCMKCGLRAFSVCQKSTAVRPRRS
ncbi:hypothetical protein HPB51_027396 [Rhipicephalus microplus]|uniref:Uncharacterized protein n=1 Tax=Rhipicephalus microplus TaxID=6941 RepID=A0A9J6D0B7_RHIMP|nr:hypothetical protein HPB51_027396 [Rhipicephalus microplus]